MYLTVISSLIGPVAFSSRPMGLPEGYQNPIWGILGVVWDDFWTFWVDSGMFWDILG